MKRGGLSGNCPRNFRREMTQPIAVDAIPNGKQIMSAVAKHAPCLRSAFDLVRVEHHGELADDKVETCILERKTERIRLTEGDVR